MKTRHNTLFLLLSSALLTACGGGGGGGGSSETPATVQPAPVVVNAPAAPAPAPVDAPAQADAPQQVAPVVAVNAPLAPAVVNAPLVPAAPAPAPVDAPAAPVQADAPQQVDPVVAVNAPLAPAVVNAPLVPAAPAPAPLDAPAAPVQADAPQQVAPVVAVNAPLAPAVVNAPLVPAAPVDAPAAPAQADAPQQVDPVVAVNAPLAPAVVNDPLIPVQHAPVVEGAPVAPAPLAPPADQYKGRLKEITLHNSVANSDFDTLSPDREFTAKIAGTDIVIEVAPLNKQDEKDNRKLTGQGILPLRDADKKLAGYYGYVITTVHREDMNSFNEQEKTTLSLAYAVNINERHRPTTAAEYKGTVFYNQFDIPREAELTLHYADNKITGDIIGHDATLNGNIHYDIRDDNSNTVAENGSFGARLHDPRAAKNAVNGYIKGSFYGKEAEMAVGEVEFIDSRNNNPVGVFGAQKVTTH